MDGGSNPPSSTNKGKTNPSGLAFFCLLPRVYGGCCGFLRTAERTLALTMSFSPNWPILSRPIPTPICSKVRKTLSPPPYKSRVYALTNQSVFLWHWCMRTGNTTIYSCGAMVRKASTRTSMSEAGLRAPVFSEAVRSRGMWRFSG